MAFQVVSDVDAVTKLIHAGLCWYAYIPKVSTHIDMAAPGWLDAQHTDMLRRYVDMGHFGILLED